MAELKHRSLGPFLLLETGLLLLPVRALPEVAAETAITGEMTGEAASAQPIRTGELLVMATARPAAAVAAEEEGLTKNVATTRTRARPQESAQAVEATVS
mmetsp:Transcript_67350/g.140726  ORF Transcript_67350/g.140726 Transcript_67350/m.140726 type:complete len:100 (+) Transcript_67350:411-710(+)